MATTIDGRPAEIPPFSEAERTAVVAPLSAAVCDLLRRRPSHARVLIGITGAAGVGKSTLAARLAAHWQDGQLHDAVDRIPCVGVDGFHLTNTELDQLPCELAVYPAHRGRQLRRIKGAPETFAAAALADALTDCQQYGRACELPAYDRQLHEPVAGRIAVGADDPLVLVEGNFLLLTEGAWPRARAALQQVVHLDADQAEIEQNLLARHRRSGRDDTDARHHIATVDRVNIQRMLAVADGADHRITIRGHRLITCADTP
jgi:pantothenate kinase